MQQASFTKSFELMTRDELISKIIEDFVDNREVYNDMKLDISTLVKENDEGKDYNLTYDEFCSKCLTNMRREKDIEYNLK